ncbi:MAG: hypothetical protein IH870_03725 [Chloroflexi bacterium]|nr:hypothetical protein [Chloroflexota bacterium]
MLKSLLKGLLGRLVSYIGLALGFWLLYQALLQANLLYGISLGLLGGASILLGMYLLVTARHIAGDGPVLDLDQEKEGTAGDSFTGSSQSDKLSP